MADWGDRPQPPERGGERESIEGFLDLQRASVVWKARGLSDELAAKQLLPSITTVSGLIRHLADVERSWFRTDMDGQADVPARWTDDDPDGEWRVTAADRLDDIIADYEAACQESREVASRYDLDELCRENGQRFTLRWIELHMLEETARHLGHIDILREQLDGRTGE